MKKIIVSILLLLPLGLIAQEMKIALVNQNEVFSLMPELPALQEELIKTVQQWEADIASMGEDFNRKYNAFIEQGDTLNENIRNRRMQEIQNLEERMQSTRAAAEEDIQNKRQELYYPVQEKMLKIIKEVGDEDGYAFVLDNNPQIVLYVGKNAIDITDKVKAKLGIK